MAGKYSDERIAATLNRLGLKTGAGNGWSELRVRTLRYRLGVAEFDPATVNSTTMTLEQAAEKLAVSVTVVRRLIAENKVPAAQVIQGAPWEDAPPRMFRMLPSTHVFASNRPSPFKADCFGFTVWRWSPRDGWPKTLQRFAHATWTRRRLWT